MKVVKQTILTACCVLALAGPAFANAAPADSAQYFLEIFPFMKTWLLLFLVWSVIFISWYFASPKGKKPSPRAGRICIELVVLSLAMAFFGFFFLLFYWVYMVGRELRLSWKKYPDLSPGVRKFSLLFHGSTILILLVSAPVAYVGHDSPENLVERLGQRNYGFWPLPGKILSRGQVMAPKLRKALTDGISDPSCKDYYGAPGCMRAYHAARLLGDMKDIQSLDVLVSAATMTVIDAKISETAKQALRTIGSKAISPLLDSPDLRQRRVAGKALAVINDKTPAAR